jgi:hypothetical protein
MSDPVQPRTPKRRTRRMAREPQKFELPASLPSPAPSVTKSQTIVELLQRPEGCSLGELVAATGWQPHTTRAALTGLKKKGHQLASTKADGGERIYRITAAEPVQ